MEPSTSNPGAMNGYRKWLTTALVISVCVVDSVTIAYEGSLMGSLNVMESYRNYFKLTTSTTAVNTCATFLGAIAVGPFAGMLIDWKGRRAGLYAACVINIAGAVIAGAAVNIAMFIAGRIILGVGVGLGQTSASTYVAETTAPTIRSFALGLYFSCWAVGSLLASSVSYGSSSLEPSNWSWRIPSYLQAAAPAAVLGLVPFLPESPRWLAYNDRREEALQVLARINGKQEQNPDVQLQFREVVDTLEYYFGSMLTQAGLGDPTTQLKINVCLSSWQLVVAIIGSGLSEKLGRRVLVLTSLGLCSVFFYLLAGLTAKFGTAGDTAGTYGTVACIFLFLGSYAFGITPLTAMYAPEVLPYNMRANGIAMQGIVLKSCGVLVSMAFPYMLEAIGWKTYIINASWNILLWIYIYFQWVETKGLTLEEVDALFDGQVHTGSDGVEVLEKGVTLEAQVSKVSAS
ncbi:hypothetical protein FSARC_12124 [Fusarium sarcochroum]|uniref:Major facilitator superfamily (MFS) profile domain-containing protein n=1 Tax=Fusarium sarcochroum TaxID=1208366 RepID=A0A8H4WYL8_9HYPO|nr:hypothetical protein FSARC_12124 [Fusarium sarcochroum]